MNIKLIILFSFFCQLLIGQDTLVFLQKKNSVIEYKLPVGEFAVKIKPKGKKKFSAIINSYHDSTFTFNVRNPDKTMWNEISKRYQQFWDSISSLNLNRQSEYDSIMAKANITSNFILFPVIKELKLSQIKKIKIDNHDIKSKKKLLKVIEIVLFASLPILVLPPLIGSIGPIVGACALGILATSITLELILASKKINLESKWSIKPILK